MKSRVFIIAEAGVNHDGDLSKAKQLVERAKLAGADCVKFQSFRATRLSTTFAPLAAYQKEKSPQDQSQHSMLKRLELSIEMHRELKTHADELGIEFLSTPFDKEMVSFLVSLGVKRLKVSSGDFDNFELLHEVAITGLPLILSTGMATTSEVLRTAAFLRDLGVSPSNVTFLQCTTQYPTPIGSANLRAMGTLVRLTGSPAGFSDHTLGINAAIAAVALGAEILEKHLTLDKQSSGPDHAASLNPEEFAEMVSQVREIEEALGDGLKEPQAAERENAVVARKSLVAKTPIKEGEPFTRENLTAKRPAGGIPPSQYFDLLGTRAPKDFGIDEFIEV